MLDRRSLILGLATGLAGCGIASTPTARATPEPGDPRLRLSPQAAKLIAAARAQIGVTLRYDPAYTALAFPSGDVPREKGVCTDVVIRAYRDAFGIDLQALVNADMRKDFAAYPNNWGLSRTDRSIDHRRVPNLAKFLTRHGARVAVPPDGSGWQPGDIFTSMVAGKYPHIGVVSDRTGAKAPLVVHNIGAGTREADVLLDWPITGRFRWQV
ncbi:MAG: DUF1287 domain-containing protein [Pseudomonadota bacterium]